MRGTRIIFMMRCASFVVASILLSMFAGQSFAEESLDESIKYLIEREFYSQWTDPHARGSGQSHQGEIRTLQRRDQNS